MDGLLAAARFGDPVAHTASKGWMIAGLVAGALVGAAAVLLTGGAALTVFAAMAAGAAAGGGLGEVLGTMSWAPRHVTGSLIRGSPNVFINSRPAMRAQLSLGVCSDHPGPPQIVGQGSSTVYINDHPASRKEDKLMCSAVINDGSPNVFIGGATVGEVDPEIPAWVNWAMLGVGVAAAAVLAGPLVAVLGTIGGVAGGEIGSWLGGKAFGEGSDGQKWSMLGGSLLGGFAGAKGGSSLAGKLNAKPVVAETGLLGEGASEMAARQNAISQITSKIGQDIKGNPLRAQYEAEVASLSDFEGTLRAQNMSERDVAQSMHQARRDLGVKYKDATPKPLRDFIYEVNQERYSDPLGPKFEDLVEKYNGDYGKIIDAAKRPNPDVNKLLGKFSEWLEKQSTSKLSEYSQMGE
ncbi:PAAR domain-containing protein [Burkholderia ubonensis]|uniref:PAAR domain-containing protein n=2 Tax=Burkholderia ubonensis TaxID=101571 RepID=UPI002ABD986F|nr:PAAR domain-containing protein [Burkholderia ubonensis]